MKKSYLVLIVVFAIAVIAGGVYLGSLPSLAPDPETGKPTNLISCVSFNLDTLTTSSEFESIRITEEAPNDCVIFSLALNNHILNRAISLQEWYQFIGGCAILNGLYDPNSGVAYEDISVVEELCKARLSAIAGRPETFTRVDATQNTPNPISCPPFGVGEQVTIMIAGLTASDDPNVVGPVMAGHAITCEIVSCLFPTNQILHCTDRGQIPNGDIISFEYDLSVDANGDIISQTPLVEPGFVGWSVTSIHRPQI